jgi:choline dehydrogenase-like flavoprotein
MFADARQIETDSTITADICIIGAGAAGIALARELTDAHRQIVILESGGFEIEDATQQLYAGSVVGRDFSALDADRLRFLGGATNHWDGSCKPFDAIDFEKRDYIRHSGWPFGRAELEPYYRKAQVVCQLGPYTYDPAAWKNGGPGPLDLGHNARIRTGMFQNSPPTRFGIVYRDDLAHPETLRVLLHANVVDIETTENASEVTALRVACLDGPKFRVKAQQYVIATGGIENARLLLNADKVEKGGLGNANDLVGRYFMDHPNLKKTGVIAFSERYPNLDFYDYHLVNGVKIYGYLTATPETQRREGLPNFFIGLDHGQLADESMAVASLRSIYKSVRSGHWPDRLGFHLGRVVHDVDGLASALYQHATHRDAALFSTSFACEVAPDPDSRVALTRETDALGQRRVQLDWRLPGDFAALMRRSHEIVGEELGRLGLGRLRINTADTVQDPMTDIENGHHHMGTTRMHEDPRQGVVDADCRVHGKANLFIAGSSLYPTYSFDDPTMTLVALAIRLADHRKSNGV